MRGSWPYLVVAAIMAMGIAGCSQASPAEGNGTGAGVAAGGQLRGRVLLVCKRIGEGVPNGLYALMGKRTFAPATTLVSAIGCTVPVNSCLPGKYRRAGRPVACGETAAPPRGAPARTGGRRMTPSGSRVRFEGT